MEFLVLTIAILIISFLWALLSLFRELKKERDRIERDSYRERAKEWDGEEIVLFER